MKRKSLFLSALFVICGIALLCTAWGCKKPEEKPEPTEGLTLSESVVEMEVFETQTLTVLTEGVQGAAWTSSDAAVATVSDGKITALKAGKTTITAKAGDKEGKCEVTVLDLGAYPSMTVSSDTLNIKNGKSAFVEVGMQFKGESVAAEFEYFSEDESIATFTEGTVQAMGLGSTKVFVRGTYLSAEVTREITVNVKENVNFTLDVNRLELSLSEPTPEYKKTYLAEPTVYENDKEVKDPEIVWESENAEAVSVSNGLITALGDTNGEDVIVKASYTSAGGSVFSCYVKVSVRLPVLQSSFSAEFELNTDDGGKDVSIDMKGADIDANKIVSITDVDADKEIKFTKAENGITVAKSELYSGIRTWKFDLGDVVYTANVKAVTRYLRTAQDITDLQKYCMSDKLTEKVSYTQNGLKAEGYRYHGYFELVNDIDYGGNILPYWCGKNEYGNNAPAENSEVFGFHGTLEGNGHSISNFKTDEPKDRHFAGLFGTLGKGGVVRNLALLNAQVGYTSGAIAGIMDGTVENVLITGKSIANNWADWQFSGMAAARCGKNLHVKNLFVLMTDTEKTDKKATAFGTLDYGSVYENVVAVGLKNAYVSGTRYGNSKTHDGEGITGFETLEKMKQSGISFESWDDIWDVSGEYPVLVPQN